MNPFGILVFCTLSINADDARSLTARTQEGNPVISNLRPEDYEVCLYHHHNDSLWTLIGRCFADSGIRRELGAPMASNENHYRLVVTLDGKLAAFGAAKLRGKAAALLHAYVFPEHRGRGVFSMMLRRGLELLDAHGATRITTCCTPASHTAHLKAGFIETGTRGQYFMLGYDKALANANFVPCDEKIAGNSDKPLAIRQAA